MFTTPSPLSPPTSPLGFESEIIQTVNESGDEENNSEPYNPSAKDELVHTWKY